MFLDYGPGNFVIYPKDRSWGIDQMQSIIKNKITVSFENTGKKVINSNEVILEKLKTIE